MSILGDNIKKLREKNKWTLNKLSIKSGIPVSTLHGIEKGADPSFDKISKLAKAFNVTTEDLTHSNKAKEIFKKADKILDAYNKNGYEDGTRDSISTLLDPEFLVKFKNLSQGIAFDHFKSLLRYCNDFKKLPVSKVATEKYYEMFLKTIQYIDDELEKLNKSKDK